MTKSNVARVTSFFVPVLTTSALLLSSVSVLAGDNNEIIVTANRTAMPLSQVSSSVTLISEKEIKNSQQTVVSELLRSVPGLDVVNNGPGGGNTAVFMRGANSDQTLVLIDGIEANDPISPGRGFDFSNLSVNNIERIEIIRGPQSTLYGSNAMGGVINIITKHGTQTPKAILTAEAGAYRTYNQQMELSGGNETATYSLGISHQKSGGISSADSADGNTEKDDYQNLGVSSRVNYVATDQLDVDVILRLNEAKFGVDDYANVSPFGFMDDLNAKGESKTWFGRIAANLALWDDKWQQTLGMSYSKQHRVNSDGGPDAAQPIDFAFIDEFDSHQLKLDWQNNLQLNNSNTLIIGTETKQEEGSTINHFGSFSPKQSRNNALYIQENYQSGDTISTSLGARYDHHDHHDQFGSATTYRASGAYTFSTNTTLKASLGSGFKAPSLFQLYDTTYGNEKLKAERSVGADIGVAQRLDIGNTRLSATYFLNKFKQLIDFDFVSSSYFNISEAKTQGVEVAVDSQPVQRLVVGMTYTYTDTENLKNHKRLLRRPLNKASAHFDFAVSEKTKTRLEANYVGKRDEFDGSVMGEYLLFNLLASHEFNDHVKLFGRIQNLLDEDYVEVKGFGTAGMALYAGVTLEF